MLCGEMPLESNDYVHLLINKLNATKTITASDIYNIMGHIVHDLLKITPFYHIPQSSD